MNDLTTASAPDRCRRPKSQAAWSKRWLVFANRIRSLRWPPTARATVSYITTYFTANSNQNTDFMRLTIRVRSNRLFAMVFDGAGPMDTFRLNQPFVRSSQESENALPLPRRHGTLCSPEFAFAELAEYDEIQRAPIKYTHPESQCDAALHATNYALSLATPPSL